MKRFLALFLLTASTCFAQQGLAHFNIALATVSTNQGTFTTPIPNAIITICNGSVLPALGFTCTNLATVYQDPFLVSGLQNPTNADSNGNYFFYGAPGEYIVSVAGTNLTTYSYHASLGLPLTPNTMIFNPGTADPAGLPGQLNYRSDLACLRLFTTSWNCLQAGANLLTTNNVWTGTNSFTLLTTFQGAVVASIFNGGYNVNACSIASPPAWCNGTDVGAWVNAANAALTAGGDVQIPAGTYNFTTPMVLTKPIMIRCAPGGATTLNYTASTGSAVTFNYGGVSTTHTWGAGMDGCTLVGPGTGTSAVGLFLGGTNGAEGVVRRNLKITNFGTAETYGNNTYLTKCDHCVYIGNGAPTLNIPNSLSNSGESFAYVESAIANAPGTGANCVSVAAPVNNLSFTGGSFDNCQFTMSAGQVHLTAIHFENPAQTSTVPFVNVTGGNLSIVSSDMQWDGTSNLPSPSSAITCSAGFITMEGMSFFAGASPIISANVNLTGTCSLHEYGTKLSSGFTQLLTNSSSGAVSSYGNIWGNNQLLNTGSFQLTGGNLILGIPPPGNGYTIQITNPAAARTIGLVDPLAPSNLALTYNTVSPVIQSKRVAGCATAASLNATCDTTITWNTAFGDANYSVACTGLSVTSGVPTIEATAISSAQTGAGTSVRTVAITASAAQFSNISCIAIHD